VQRVEGCFTCFNSGVLITKTAINIVFKKHSLVEESIALDIYGYLQSYGFFDKYPQPFREHKKSIPHSTEIFLEYVQNIFTEYKGTCSKYSQT